MTSPSLPRLLSPLPVGPVELMNRVVSTAHQTSLVRDGMPTPEFVAYHAARAEGGVGLIVLEAIAVHPTGTLSDHSIAGFDARVVPHLAAVARAVRAGGTKLFAQLFHGGREHWEDAPRAPVVAPSAVPSPRFKTEPRALTHDEIEAIVQGYEAAAARCREAGLDGVELCASHGYLPAQFVNARTNHRDDEWGADPLAFVRAALAALRRGAGPELAVGIRLSADEQLPEGRDAGASAALLSALDAERLIDYASVVIGDSAEYVGAAYIVPPPPVRAAVVDQAAAVVRSRLRIPVIAATRVSDPADAERLLAAGAADAVGMTRALIADPALPRLVAQGRGSERIDCIGCNLCISRYHRSLPIRCLQNPRTGRESEPPPATDASGMRLVVVGAGPAGLAAAETAALAGADVLLLEREAQIGGQLALAARAPAHAELSRRFVADRLRRLAAAGVRLELRVAFSPGMLDDLSADAVVLASGARPYVPQALPSPGVAVVDAWGVLRDPTTVAGPALVAEWGGGTEGLDVTEILARAGLDVTLAVGAAAVGETVHQYARTLYLARLERLGVPILHYRSLDTTGPELALRSIWTHATEPLPDRIRTVVLAQGRVPADEAVLELERLGVDYVAAGDCLGPRSAEEAVLEGVAAAVSIISRRSS